MKTFQELLKELDACEDASEWACEKEIEEVVEKCDRGDWLLWLAKKINVDDRKLTLAKGLCANTVRHLMKDERSMRAVDAAIAYGKGEIDKEELNAAYAAAVVATAATAATAAAAAAAHSAAAAVVATAATTAATTAAYAADAYAADANAADYTARKANQMQTANICREVIGQEIIDKVNELLN